jgi:hypothetical protein
MSSKTPVSKFVLEWFFRLPTFLSEQDVAQTNIEMEDLVGLCGGNG